MRMRRKPNLDTRMERCADYLAQQPEALRGLWRSRLPSADALWLELGCGKGGFTCQTAAAHPEALMLAIERVPDVLILAMERAQELALQNTLFLDADAARLSDYLAPGELDLLYINFCDPWPGAKYAKRRLTHPNLLALYRDALRDGGEIHFKTDNRDLFAWSLFQFPKVGFRLTDVTDDLHADGIRGVMTDYEARFHAQGVPIHRCVAIKE